MRIGIDISKAIEPIDGIGNYTHHLIRSLMQLDREREYFLFSLRQPAAAADFRREFPSCPPNFVLRRAEDLAGLNLDLFHSTSWTYPPGHRGKVVYTCHDLTFLSHPQFHLAANKLNCLTGTLEAIVEGAHFIAVSRYTREQMSSLLEIPGERVTVIHNGVDEIFQPAEQELARRRLRERFGLRKPFVFSNGTLEPRKNFLRLALAYDRLPAELRERHSLVLAGSPGWLHQDLHQFLAKRRGAGEVRILGFVDKDDLVDLYSVASAYVYASLAEGFGLPVVEALACEAPVLTSAVSSLPEVAEEAALYFNPEDVDDIAASLESLLSDGDLERRLRRCARDQSRKFSWGKAARETHSLYTRLCCP